jgi:hypothetical protein
LIPAALNECLKTEAETPGGCQCNRFVTQSSSPSALNGCTEITNIRT